MDNQMCCPKCGSTSIHADKRGFSTGKAIAGGILTGNILITAASGGIGMNKIKLTCLSCGHQFKIGDQAIKTNAYSSQEIKEFESHVIPKEECEKTQRYRCDCGKESCLPINRPICPKCGRRLHDEHKISINKSGCFGHIALLIASTSLLILTLLIL